MCLRVLDKTWPIITEVEMARRNDRPKLAKALAACRKHKARLVIAKLKSAGSSHLPIDDPVDRE
jgi:hypothetical protein